MKTNIKNQHYVWRHYLNPWINNGKIWCIRDAEPFNINVEKIAKEDYFYAADPLNNSDKNFIEQFICGLHPTGQPLLKSIFDIYLLFSYSSDFQRRNAIENYHSTIERSAISILEKIYSGDLSFWENESERINFSYFIGMQYTRTKKSIDRITMAFNALKNHPSYPTEIDPIKIAKVLSLLFGEIIGNWLYSSASPRLMINNSETRFLTSDQPVYNLNTDFMNAFTPPTQFKLYYPISPQKALIFNAKDKIGNEENQSNYDVFNQFIIKSSREYVFSDSKLLLTMYREKGE